MASAFNHIIVVESRLCTWLVPVLPRWSVSVCSLTRFDSSSANMCGATRIGSRTDSIIHGRFASTFSCTLFGTLPLCRWHTDLWFLSSSSCSLPGTSELCLSVHQWCSWLDEISQTATECWQNKISSRAHHHVTSIRYKLLRLSLLPMSSHQSHQCETSESTSTQIYRCKCIFPRLCQLVLQSSVNSQASVGLSLDQSSSCWLHLWCSPDWTLVARHWLVCLHGKSTDYSVSWILLPSSCTRQGGVNMCLLFFKSSTGWAFQSGSTFTLPF